MSNNDENIYNDEIAKIEFVGIRDDLVDITTDGNHLFYANGILTHNSGSKSSDPNETDLADSYGLMFTADLALIILNSEELKEDGQFMFKQVKNRYHNLDFKSRFIMGINKQLMTIYDIDNTTLSPEVEAKMDMHEAAIFDTTSFGENVIKFEKNSLSKEWDNV